MDESLHTAVSLLARISLRDSHAVFIVQDFTPSQPDRAYQLWLIRNGTRDNGGIFRVDEYGFGLLLVRAPHPLAAYRAAGITEEPAGGTAQALRCRVLSGEPSKCCVPQLPRPLSFHKNGVRCI